MKKKRTKINIIIEEMSNNYSAYIVEYPGCIATGISEEDVKDRLIEAFKFHMEGLSLEGEDYKPQAKIEKASLLVG
jgi:predicted RNase H-like HicB family nuclease